MGDSSTTGTLLYIQGVDFLLKLLEFLWIDFILLPFLQQDVTYKTGLTLHFKSYDNLNKECSYIV